MKQALICYVPVVHAGYLGLLKKYPNAELLIVADEFLNQFRPLQKDVRRLSAEQAAAALHSIFPEMNISLLDEDAVKNVQKHLKDLEIIAPQDEVLETLFDQWGIKDSVRWDSVFLRWTRTNSEAERKVQPGYEVSRDRFVKETMGQAAKFAQRSSDWWRQVAAVLIKDKQVLLAAYNSHSPVAYAEYRDGDPRANYQSGERIELSTSIHAEAAVIGAAAARGISTAGCDLFVTTFPCPYCARMLAQSGIKRIYFQTGYSLIDGDEVLKQADIELVQVVVEENQK